jgi:hypothetical protein
VGLAGQRPTRFGCTRKRITELVSIEETSTQVQVVFFDALEAEGLLELVEARQDQAPADTFPLDADVDATERHARNTQVQRSVVRFPIGAVLRKTALLQAE